MSHLQAVCGQSREDVQIVTQWSQRGKTGKPTMRCDIDTSLAVYNSAGRYRSESFPTLSSVANSDQLIVRPFAILSYTPTNLKLDYT